jgi:hypothetical protein
MESTFSSYFISSFSQRVGSFISIGGSPVSFGLPTDKNSNERPNATVGVHDARPNGFSPRRMRTDGRESSCNVGHPHHSQASFSRTLPCPQWRTLPPPSATARSPHSGTPPRTLSRHKRATHHGTASHSAKGRVALRSAIPNAWCSRPSFQSPT